MPCPDDDMLTEWLDGVTTPEVSVAVRAHVASCPRCMLVTQSAGEPVDDDATVRLGRYLLGSPLGTGGMGQVFEATDTLLDRPVAIKLFREESGPSARVLDEARALAKVEHPNVITVFDVGEHQGRVYIAMERVRGSSLADRLVVDPPPRRVVLAMLERAGRGLAAAHRCGIIHHDVKLANILVTSEGAVKVIDFGLARAVADASVVAPAGTPGYIAPERRSGRSDVRGDQYGFAVAVVRALARTASAGEVTTDAPTDALRSLPVSGAMRRALGRALAAEPEDRFESMDVLLDALFVAPRRRRRVAIATAVAAVSGVSALAIVPAVTRAPGSPCEYEAALLQAWGGPIRDEFRGDPASLDAYAVRVRELVAPVCSGQQVVAQPDDERWRRCVRERTADLAALARLGPDAPAALGRLEDPLACNHLRSAPTARPLEPGARGEALRAEAALADRLAVREPSLFVLAGAEDGGNDLLVVTLPGLHVAPIGRIDHRGALWELARVGPHLAASIDREADAVVTIDLRDASVVRAEPLGRDVRTNGRGLAADPITLGLLIVFDGRQLARRDAGGLTPLVELTPLQGGPEALADCPDGRVFLAGSASGSPRGTTLFELDARTLTTVWRGPIGEVELDIDTLACLGGDLFGADTRGPEDTMLHHIDREDGRRTAVGSIPRVVNGLLAVEPADAR